MEAFEKTISDLCLHEAFADLLPDVPRRRLESMSRKGEFPPFVRWTPHSAPLWSRAAVMNWIEARIALIQPNDRLPEPAINQPQS